jgi:chromosome segregation protein
MDEVDAPLDDANVGRFTTLLEEFKQSTQFLVITHNPRTMQSADAVYGVTMQEPGVSTIVGVRLHEPQEVGGSE